MGDDSEVGMYNKAENDMEEEESSKPSVNKITNQMT